MTHHIETNEKYRIGSIVQKNSRIFYAKLTVDIQTSNTPAFEALQEVYAEALLSGAGKFSREAFLNEINKLGASVDVSINDSKLTISLRSSADNASRLMTLFTLMLDTPTFAQNELHRIKTLITNELTEHTEDSKAVAYENLANQLYSNKDRRYTAPIQLIQKNVSRITQKDLQTLHQQIRSFYWSATVGTHSETVINFSEVLKKIKAAEQTTLLKKEHVPKLPKESLVLKNIPGKQNIDFSIGGALPLTLHHPDFIPFTFGLNVLGKWGGFTGRLMSTIREKEGLTYGIYAKIETVSGEETGFWRIMTFFSPEQSHQGLTSTLREVNLIAKKGITEDEYRRFKTILITQQTLLNDSYIRTIADFHFFVSEGFEIEEMKELKSKMHTVSKKEINTALAKYLDPKKIVISGAGPVETVKQALQKLV